MSRSICLASGSQSRAGMLTAAGVEFERCPVKIDEEAIRNSLVSERLHPRDIADALAEAKARKATARTECSMVLGSDQILSCNGRILGKAEEREEAADQLGFLSDQRHSLYSAVVIFEDAAPVWRHVGVAHLKMRSLSQADISRYLDRAWPEVAGSVGCYHLEGLGLQLFERVDGDIFTVQGLPMLPLIAFLRLQGKLDI